MLHIFEFISITLDFLGLVISENHSHFHCPNWNLTVVSSANSSHFGIWIHKCYEENRTSSGNLKTNTAAGFCFYIGESVEIRETLPVAGRPSIYYAAGSSRDWYNIMFTVPLLKDSDYIGIFHCFSSFGTILFIIPFSESTFARKNLRNPNDFSHQTSHTCRPLPLIVHLIFFERIRITILDLEPNLDFQTFLIISKTYHRIFNSNISKRRSGQELPFILFELRALACLWGRYDPKPKNFALFYIYLLHIHSLSQTFYILI